VIGANWVSNPLPERLVDVRKAQKGDRSIHDPNQTLQSLEALRWDTFSSWGKYSQALGATTLRSRVQKFPSDGLLWVGSVAAGGCCGESYDKDGIIWPVASHPTITIPNLADAQQIEAAEQLYTQLNSSGIETLLDDRDGAGVGLKMQT